MPLSDTAEIVRTQPAFFIDLEASSLFTGSWPVELGIARIEDGVVSSDARLIRPHESWDESKWVPESEEIHGISRGHLAEHGHDPLEVIEWFRRLNVGVAVTDAPEFDAMWLGKLLLLAEEKPQVQMVDFDTYLMMTLPDTGAVNAAYDYIRSTKTPHRAGPDAHRMAKAWLTGSRYAKANGDAS